MIKLDEEEMREAEEAGIPMVKAQSVQEAVRTVISLMGFNPVLLTDEQVNGMLWMVGREIHSKLSC